MINLWMVLLSHCGIGLATIISPIPQLHSCICRSDATSASFEEATNISQDISLAKLTLY